MAAPVNDARATDTYQQMEATILRQLLQASGAFKPADVAGGQLRADMFVETLADAVAKGGGIGIAHMFEDLTKKPSAPSRASSGAPSSALSPSPPSSRPSSSPLTSSPPSSSPPTVTSGFGMRTDPIDGASKYHIGVDLRAAEGSPILVAEDGVVRRAGPRGGYGNAIEIDHGDGLTTVYGHASQVSVTPGEKVTAGQQIGQVGHTGHATGPHLHFEIRQNDQAMDPARFPGLAARALNAYQKRAEESLAGKLDGPRGGETP